ncbi:hypothetical protein CsatA_002059 [Cannabis sativa]
MAEEEEQESTTENVTTMAEEQSSSSSISHKTIKRFDSFDIESRTYLGHGSHDGSKVMKWSTVLHLAFQSIGIVYGDIGTSPLYVYASTFPNGIIKHEDDILGAFSIIFYTITLSTLVKYVFIVLRATDNGDGGTFALYSLICRYAKVGLTPSEQAEDTNISNFKLELPTKRVKLATWVKSRLEKSDIAKYFLLIVTFLGTSMLIGDGIFTPCISVLSAVGGIKEADPSMTQGPMYWPMFVVAILAAIIASQSLISGTFSIVQQSLSMGCFPRVKIIHTSATHKGQVYIPEINYLLMVACVAVTLGFKTGVQLGNAYGLAVVFVMIITSSFLVIIMTMIWKTHILLILLYIVTIGTMEVMYLTSVLYKFDQGGYLPLAFATILVTIMFVWHNVYLRKYKYESNNKVSPQMVNDIMNNIRITRMPGIALFYSELVQGIPPIFKHYVQNMPALHSTLIFVSKKSLPISKVSPEERFLFRRLEPKELNMFRCVARYGYRDSHKESEPFEKMLVDKLKEFIMKKNSEEVISSSNEQEELLRSDEIERIDKAFNDHGVVHLMGESQVFAGAGANLGKKILIDYAYDFLVRNLRQSSNHSFDIPHKRMVKVGMTYEL